MVALSGAVLITSLISNDEQPIACDPVTGEFTHSERESIFHIYSCGVDASDPVGVLVHLHGDGAGEFVGPADPDGTLNSLARIANDRNLLLVTPQTPDQGNGWTWWRNLDANVAWLSAFMQDEVLARQQVDADNVWWSGYSGGAEMLSYGVLPNLSPLVTSGAIMMAGGGAPPDDDQLGHPYSSDKRDSLPLRWIVGELDDGTHNSDGFDALAAAREGAEWYRGRGFNEVDLEITPGDAHDDLPQASVLESALDSTSG